VLPITPPGSMVLFGVHTTEPLTTTAPLYADWPTCQADRQRSLRSAPSVRYVAHRCEAVRAACLSLHRAVWSMVSMGGVVRPVCGQTVLPVCGQTVLCNYCGGAGVLGWRYIARQPPILARQPSILAMSCGQPWRPDSLGHPPWRPDSLGNPNRDQNRDQTAFGSPVDQTAFGSPGCRHQTAFGPLVRQPWASCKDSLGPLVLPPKLGHPAVQCRPMPASPRPASQVCETSHD
jgi:hypothetical protein